MSRDNRTELSRRPSIRERPTIATLLCAMLAGGAMMFAAGCASDRPLGLDEACPPRHARSRCSSFRPARANIVPRRSRRGRVRGSPCSKLACRQAISLARWKGPPSFGKSARTLRHDEPARDRRGRVYAELASHLSGRVGSNRDILLYVHGFNVSYDEARFRLAQISHDGRFGGVAVLYTWPATGSLLDYGAAKENATAARDALTTSFTGWEKCRTLAACIFSRTRWAPGSPWRLCGKMRFPAAPTSMASSRCHARRATSTWKVFRQQLARTRSVPCLRSRFLQRTGAFDLAHACGRRAAV